MAFMNKNMSVIAYANGFTWWHYVSENETIADITADNFFNNVKTLINNGDIIIINATDGTCQAVFINKDNIKLFIMGSAKYETVQKETETKELSEDNLCDLMKDPKYWRDNDSEYVKKIQAGFNKLYGGQ